MTPTPPGVTRSHRSGTPNVTDPDADWWGLLWITLVPLLFLAIGFAGLRRRDLARQ